MDVEPFLAADEHRQRVRAELGYADQHVVIGKIARLFHLKGHEYLIAGRVASRAGVSRNARFLLVGDGLLRQDLESQIAASRAGGATSSSPGWCRPQRIPELVGAMDILVHVSLREGLARALPQALIAGKPVVSYDVDGAREVVIARRDRVSAAAAEHRAAGRRVDPAWRAIRLCGSGWAAAAASGSRSSSGTST